MSGLDLTLKMSGHVIKSAAFWQIGSPLFSLKSPEPEKCLLPETVEAPTPPRLFVSDDVNPPRTDAYLFDRALLGSGQVAIAFAPRLRLVWCAVENLTELELP